MAARAASLIGREHVRLGRNNQDGWAVAARGDVVVGVVADGCSSQPRSEVGAQLGARFLANWLIHSNDGEVRGLAQRATDALTAWLYRAASDLDAAPESLSTTLDTYFLFTFLCAVKTNATTLVFGIGDGAILVDGALVRLDAGPENAPPYCAYRLSPSGHRPEPALHFLGEAKQVAIMTDGFDPLLVREPGKLSAFLDEPALWKNPLTLQRRLNVLGETEKLADDATLVVLGGA